MSKRGHPEEQIPRALHRRLQGVPRGQMRIISRRSVVIPSEKWRDKSTFSSWVLSPTGFRIPPLRHVNKNLPVLLENLESSET
jgi:hypothetical protein